MKAREPRRKVMLRARMRSAASWHDACILNLSSRGLMLQTATPPERGTVIELRRGPNIIIARVVWTKSHRVGLKAQDLLPIEAIIADLPVPARTEAKPVERRQATRPALRHERSRERARVLEFAGMAAAGLLAAFVALGLVQDALGEPMSRVSAALAAGKG